MTTLHLKRPQRPSLSLPDLGPWAGVLLILSTFCMLTGHIADSSPRINLPSTSTIACRWDMNNFLIISIDAQNRVYLEANDTRIQAAMVEQVARQHHIHFTAAQHQELQRMPFLNQDIRRLPAWLSASRADRRQMTAGVPMVPGNDQLAEYISAGQAVSQALFSRRAYVMIKMDQALPSIHAKRMFHWLESQGIERYNLMAQYQNSRFSR